MHARVLSRHGPRTPDQHSGLPFIQAQRVDGKYRETGLTSTMSNSRASEATSATSTIPGSRNSPASSALIPFARRSEREFQGAINRTWPPGSGNSGQLAAFLPPRSEPQSDIRVPPHKVQPQTCLFAIITAAMITAATIAQI